MKYNSGGTTEHGLQHREVLDVRDRADDEIFVLVLDGAIRNRHKDQSESLIRSGDVLRISTDSNDWHYQINADGAEHASFLQIQPGRDRRLPEERLLDVLKSDDLCAALLARGHLVEFWPASGDKIWVEVLHGSVQINGCYLQSGDWAALADASKITMRALDGTELVLLDML